MTRDPKGRVGEMMTEVHCWSAYEWTWGQGA